MVWTNLIQKATDKKKKRLSINEKWIKYEELGKLFNKKIKKNG